MAITATVTGPYEVTPLNGLGVGVGFDSIPPQSIYAIGDRRYFVGTLPVYTSGENPPTLHVFRSNDKGGNWTEITFPAPPEIFNAGLFTDDAQFGAFVLGTRIYVCYAAPTTRQLTYNYFETLDDTWGTAVTGGPVVATSNAENAIPLKSRLIVKSAGDEAWFAYQNEDITNSYERVSIVRWTVGSGWGTPTLLAAAPDEGGAQVLRDIAIDSAGNGYVLTGWKDYSITPPTDRYGYARQYITRITSAATIDSPIELNADCPGIMTELCWGGLSVSSADVISVYYVKALAAYDPTQISPVKTSPPTVSYCRLKAAVADYPTFTAENLYESDTEYGATSWVAGNSHLYPRLATTAQYEVFSAIGFPFSTETSFYTAKLPADAAWLEDINSLYAAASSYGFYPWPFFQAINEYIFAALLTEDNATPANRRTYYLELTFPDVVEGPITVVVDSLTNNPEYPFSVEPVNPWNGDWGPGPQVDTGFSNIGDGGGSGPGQDAGGGQDFDDPGWTEQVIEAEVTSHLGPSATGGECGGVYGPTETVVLAEVVPDPISECGG